MEIKACISFIMPYNVVVCVQIFFFSKAFNWILLGILLFACLCYRSVSIHPTHSVLRSIRLRNRVLFKTEPCKKHAENTSLRHTDLPLLFWGYKVSKLTQIETFQERLARILLSNVNPQWKLSRICEQYLSNHSALVCNVL